MIRTRTASRRLGLVLLLALAARPSALDAQQPPPSFQSSVEVTSLDVTVVDDRGGVITDLSPTDFVVRIDNRVRRVVSAEWVPLSGAAASPVVAVPKGYSSNENAAGGQLTLA